MTFATSPRERDLSMPLLLLFRNLPNRLSEPASTEWQRPRASRHVFAPAPVCVAHQADREWGSGRRGKGGEAEEMLQQMTTAFVCNSLSSYSNIDARRGRIVKLLAQPSSQGQRRRSSKRPAPVCGLVTQCVYAPCSNLRNLFTSHVLCRGRPRPSLMRSTRSHKYS